MKDLFRWEMKQNFSSKSMWGVGAALVFSTLLLLLPALSDSALSGMDVFLHGCNDFNSLLLLFIGIYAGIHVSGAFEERRIQAAIMAGNSRFSVLLAKLFSYSLSVAVYCAAALIPSAALAFITKGLTGVENSFFRDVILRIFCYTLVETSFAGICFVLSAMVKNVGASIALNLFAMVAINFLCQFLLEQAWAEGILRFTSAGQTFMLLYDASAENLLLSAIVAALGLVLKLGLSYMVFKKEELK